MKTIVRVATTAILMCFLFTSFSHAQLSKEEKKEMKRLAKELKRNPEELKALIDENESMKSSVNRLKTQVENLEAELSNKNAEIASAKSEAQEAKAQLSAMQSRMKQLKAETKKEEKSGYELDESGIWFKVQVGAFKNIDMAEYFKNNPNFSGEETEEGFQRITLGRFRDYWEADKFKKVLREMGVKQAWIVPYEDGNRVALKEILEQLGPRPESAAN